MPLIEQDPYEWLGKIESKGLAGEILNYGDVLEIQ